MEKSFAWDENSFARLSKLKVSDLSDAVRQLGGRSRVARPCLRPAIPFSHLIGRAVTVRVHWDSRPSNYVKEISRLYSMGLDLYRPVVVQQNEVQGFTSIGSGGGGVAKRHGYVGWVVDGPFRDTDELKEIDFPIFGIGISPHSRANQEAGHSIHLELGTVVEIAGIKVTPGDILVGDNDGVIALAFDGLEKVLEEAEKIFLAEQRILSLLDQGYTFEEVVKKKLLDRSGTAEGEEGDRGKINQS